MTATAQPVTLRIVRDSREQQPFAFDGFPVNVEIGTLASGDYSLSGFENRIAIERKSLPDLVGCLSTDRKRFEAELARLRGYDAAAVIVESPQSDLLKGNYRSNMNPQSAWQSVIAFSMRYRLPFWFCDSRADAEQVTFDLLRHFARDRWRELQALCPAATMPPQARRDPRQGDDIDEGDNDPKSRAGAASGPPAPPLDIGRERSWVLSRGGREVVPSEPLGLFHRERMKLGMTSLKGMKP